MKPDDFLKFDSVHNRLLGKGVDLEALETAYGQIARAAQYRLLVHEMQSCRACPLHRGAQRMVPGIGSLLSPLMLVGEGLGEMEELLGVPFIGDAGHILTMTLNTIGVDRQQVYITNICHCRPPGNRTPSESEAAACYPWLQRELRTVRPRVIVTLGNTAMQTLRQNPRLKITTERGQWHTYDFAGREIALLHTYHPSYVLRQLDSRSNSAVKNNFYKDLLMAVEKARELVPEYSWTLPQR